MEPNARENGSVQSCNVDNAASKEQKQLFGIFSKTGNKRKRSLQLPMTLERIKYWNHDCICLLRRNQIGFLHHKKNGPSIVGTGAKQTLV